MAALGSLRKMISKLNIRAIKKQTASERPCAIAATRCAP